MLQLSAPPLPILLGAGEDTYTKGMSHPTRSNIGVFDLLIVTKGCLFIGEAEDKYKVQEKHALILFPDRYHFSWEPCENSTHFYWFHFTCSISWSESKDSIPLDSRNISYTNAFVEQPFYIRLPKFCNIENWNTTELLCKQILSTDSVSTNSWEWKRQILFHQLLQEIASTANLEHHAPSLAIAEQAAAYLRKHFYRKVSYQELGEVLSYHPNHIARCMVDTLGFSPTDYVNNIRIEQAKIQLLTTNLSVEKIAENCGFMQTSYFSRFFKQKIGLSPSKFRQQYSKI